MVESFYIFPFPNKRVFGNIIVKINSYNNFISLVFELLLFNLGIEVTSNNSFFRIFKPPQSEFLVRQVKSGESSWLQSAFLAGEDKVERKRPERGILTISH